MPPTWSNAALLCGRHHTIVHRKGYHGELVDGRVRWVLTPGAYDHWLAEPTSAARRPGGRLGESPRVRSYDVWGELETAPP